MSDPFDQLVRAFSRLPGIGRRSAERIALSLTCRKDVLMEPLAAAVERARRELCVCSSCGAVTSADANPCPLCTDPSRDHSILCVVEEPGDIMHIEGTGAFRGIYHSLNGRISPMSGSRPEDIRVAELLERVNAGGIREVIFALGTDTESDATVAYISELLENRDILFSRIAFGLPAGSAVAYSDSVTLGRALNGRIKI